MTDYKVISYTPPFVEKWRISTWRERTRIPPAAPTIKTITDDKCVSSLNIILSNNVSKLRQAPHHAAINNGTTKHCTNIKSYTKKVINTNNYL